MTIAWKPWTTELQSDRPCHDCGAPLHAGETVNGGIETTAEPGITTARFAARCVAHMESVAVPACFAPDVRILRASIRALSVAEQIALAIEIIGEGTRDGHRVDASVTVIPDRFAVLSPLIDGVTHRNVADKERVQESRIGKMAGAYWHLTQFRPTTAEERETIALFALVPGERLPVKK